MIIEIVNTVYIDAVWPKVSGYFAAAIDGHGDDFSTGELWQMVRSGHAFLLIVREGERIDAGVVVRFDKWAKGSILRILALGGVDMKAWKPLFLDFMQTLAKDNGASRILAEARPGMGKAFPQAKLLRCVYVMEID